MTEERTLPERADGDPDLPAALSPNKPEPENWRRDARSKVTAAMPKLVDELINRSQKGSLGHTKVLLLLCGLDKPSAQRRAAKPRDVARELARKWRLKMGMTDDLSEE